MIGGSPASTQEQGGTHAKCPAYDEAWFESRATAGLQGLRAYDPGHDLVALRRRFDAHLLELGSNENPYGPSPAARAAVVGQMDACIAIPIRWAPTSSVHSR